MKVKIVSFETFNDRMKELSPKYGKDLNLPNIEIGTQAWNILEDPEEKCLLIPLLFAEQIISAELARGEK